MRKNIVAGNWKMNKTLQEGIALAKELNEALANEKPNCDVIICTPFIHLASVTPLVDAAKIGVGAENCADKASGAYTGEVSAEMVASTGAKYVILGHSERRAYYGETYEEACLHLKQQYDGYHFSEHSEDIYNPFSLFNAFAQKKYANFWFSTGTPTFLINILQQSNFDIRELDGTTATAEQFDAPTSVITDPLPVLYQSGYLTIKGYDSEFQLYTLAYPNKEVRKGFIESLMPAYVHLPARENTFYVVSFIKDLRAGKLVECLERIRAFFASIPNDLENKQEKHYQTIFYLLFRLMGQYVDVEVKSAIGRADVVVKLHDAIYVFEFKVDGTPEEALEQINSKGYAIPYQPDHRSVVKIGVNFDSTTRTIGDWVIAEE